MFQLLDRFYEFSKRHVIFYPLFVLIKLVLFVVPLVWMEGFGSFRWLRIRLTFALRNRKILGSPTLLDQPIECYKSRQGFVLSKFVQYSIYDEIFLERIYSFRSLRPQLAALDEGVVLDFGVHHGLFINYVQSVNDRLSFYGAELSPVNYQIATKRFAHTDKVVISNMGIAGTNRRLIINLIPFSASQSIYSTGDGERAEVQIVTPVDFVAKHRLAGKTITLFKMDIEGAELEVFENFDCVRQIMRASRFFVIEIHDMAWTPLINSRMESAGFNFREQRGDNFFYINTAELVALPATAVWTEPGFS